MRRDHEVCGPPEELGLCLHAAAAPTEGQRGIAAGAGSAAVAGELARLALELGLGACVRNAVALKSELQKMVLALHPDKSGGEFASDGEKARFMKARRAIELLNSGGATGSPRDAKPLAGARPAITDASAPAASLEHEQRLQARLLADARIRIAGHFAVPRIVSAVLATLLVLVLMPNGLERHPLLAGMFEQGALPAVLALLGLSALAAAVGLWVCERAAVSRVEHLLSASALGELFEHARRSARRQGRVGRLTGFDIRRGIDALADGGGRYRGPRARRLLARSVDAATREGITRIQTGRLLARRVIRELDPPALEVLYEVSPRAVFETFR